MGLVLILIIAGFVMGLIRLTPQTLPVTLNGPALAAHTTTATVRADTGDTIRLTNHGRHSCRLHGRPQGGSILLPARGATTFTATTSGDFTLRCGTQATSTTRLHVTSVLTLST